MGLFWRQGYEGTSTQELVDLLEINRNSMYSEFGSKRGLFDAALAHYEQTWIDRNFGPLEIQGSGLTEIENVFDHYARIGRGKRSGLGCMLTNAAVELAGVDPESRRTARRFMGRVTRAFERALSNAQGAGEVADGVNAGLEARYLTATWLGMLVLARSKAGSQCADGGGGWGARPPQEAWLLEPCRLRADHPATTRCFGASFLVCIRV